MTSRTHLVIVIVASILSMSLPATARQYLYAPRPVPAEQDASQQEGILVQEVEVKKGDTMFDLSRTYSGHGMYYPQILLFNSIKNPNRIYPGNILKIPVTNKNPHVSGQAFRPTPEIPHAVSASGDATAQKQGVIQAPELKTITPTTAPDKTVAPAATEAKSTKSEKKRSGGQKKPAAMAKSEVTAHSAEAETVQEQKIFEKAVKAYRQDDCRTALELLDRYLAENPASPLAADANLYKAECYLKLSAP